MQFQLPTINYDNSDTYFFFIYLFIGDKNSETTNARNLNFDKNEVAYLQFWRRYVTCFGADAPKTCDSEFC